MNLVKLEKKIVNLDHVAFIERQDQTVRVHYAIPKLNVPSSSEFGTLLTHDSHLIETFDGTDAEILWSHVQKL